MQIFKKKEVVIPVDEDGNPIEAEKKAIDWKAVGKKVGCGLLCAVGGVFVFLAVGAAMITDDETSDDSSDSSSDDISSDEDKSSAESGENSK